MIVVQVFTDNGKTLAFEWVHDNGTDAVGIASTALSVLFHVEDEWCKDIAECALEELIIANSTQKITFCKVAEMNGFKLTYTIKD